MVKKSPKKRADLLLVERELAETRQRAQALIMEGLVYTSTGKVLKAGSLVAIDTSLEIRGRLPYVGRGGVKLAHALDRFGLDVSGLVAIDVGSSTGGFTDCLLQRGALRVFALDVGYGQLDHRLQQDPRVVVIERVNAHFPFSLPPTRVMSGDVREPDSEEYRGEQLDLATVDVSFISATKVIPQVAEHVKQGGYIIVLVKPQFEGRREEVGRGGVIRDPAVHARVLARAILWVVRAGYRLCNLVPSPILGDAGNREFFLLLKK